MLYIYNSSHNVFTDYAGNSVLNFFVPTLPAVQPVKYRFKRRSAFIEKSNNFYRLVPSGVYISSRSGGVLRSFTRSVVREFSVKSKNRLFQRIDDYNKKYKTFLTLTYKYVDDWRTRKDIDFLPLSSVGDINFLDLKSSYEQLKRFIKKINRYYGTNFLFIWKKEFTKNRMIHYHLITDADFNNSLDRKIIRQFWGSITHNDSKWKGVDFQKVKKQDSICWYLSKYLAKDSKNEKGYQLKAPLLYLHKRFVGRWWGVFNKSYHKLFPPVRWFIPNTLHKKLFRDVCRIKHISINKKNEEVKKFTPSLRFSVSDSSVSNLFELYEPDFQELTHYLDNRSFILKNFKLDYPESYEDIL